MREDGHLGGPATPAMPALIATPTRAAESGTKEHQTEGGGERARPAQVAGDQVDQEIGRQWVRCRVSQRQARNKEHQPVLSCVLALCFHTHQQASGKRAFTPCSLEARELSHHVGFSASLLLCSSFPCPARASLATRATLAPFSLASLAHFSPLYDLLAHARAHTHERARAHTHTHTHTHTHVDADRQRPGSRERERWGGRPGEQKSVTTREPCSSSEPRKAITVPVTRSETFPDPSTPSLSATRPLCALAGKSQRQVAPG